MAIESIATGLFPAVRGEKENRKGAGVLRLRCLRRGRSIPSPLFIPFRDRGDFFREFDPAVVLGRITDLPPDA